MNPYFDLFSLQHHVPARLKAARNDSPYRPLKKRRLTVALTLAACAALPGAAYATSLNGSTTVDSSTPWTADEDLYIGWNDVGEVLVRDGGQLSNTGKSTATLTIGHTSPGTANLSEGSLTVTGAGSRASTSGGLMVGSTSKGSLNITDGGVVQNNTYAYIGAYGGGDGSALVSGAGSLWQMDGAWMMIGSQGAGTLTLNQGGRVELGNARTLASRIGVNAEGALNVTGDGSAWVSTGDLAVGYLGKGELTVSDGGLVSNAAAIVGDRAGGVGFAEIDGGRWLSSGQLTVGSLGQGNVLIHNGGELVATRGITVGNSSAQTDANAALNGSVLVKGTGSRLSTDGIITVGNLGRSVFTVTDGASATAGKWMIVGNNAEGRGEVSNGARLDAAAEMSVGHNTLGVLDIYGGATVGSGLGRLGRFAGGDGHVTVSGAGSRWLNQALVLGEQGAGRLTIVDGGEVTADGEGIVRLASFDGAHGTLNIGAGQQSGSLAATEVIGGAGTAMVNFNHTDDTHFTASLTGSLSVNVLGAGTTELSGSSSYFGATSIAAGTLKAGREGAFSAHSAYALQPGAELALAGYNQTLAALENGGTVRFSEGDTSGTVLSIAGDYVGNNGLLRVNSALAGDDSVTDRMLVAGDTSGHTRLSVNNVGGTGASTHEGILLVGVNGASNGTFELQGRAVAGAYEYLLHQGSSDASDGNWYLRSALSAPTAPPVEPEPVDPAAPVLPPPVEPEPVDPALPVTPPPPRTPGETINVPSPVPPSARLLRPEAGAYLLNQAAAADMFDLSMHDRIGGPNLIEAGTDGVVDGGVWSRISTDQSRGTILGQLHGRSRQHVLHAGVDVARWGENSRGVFGIITATGETNHQVASSTTTYQAQGRVKGNAAGIYGSWIQSPAQTGGLYLDGWAQIATFRNRMQGDMLDAERYKSRSTSASLEVGYAIALRQGADQALYIEPQAQLIWGDLRMRGGGHNEVNGSHIAVAEGGGLRSRIGVRVFGHGTKPGINRVQPYLTANWLHASGTPNAVWLDEVALSGGQPKDVYQAKAGVQLQLRRGVTAWGELNGSRGNDHFRQVGGTIGLRYDW